LCLVEALGVQAVNEFGRRWARPGNDNDEDSKPASEPRHQSHTRTTTDRTARPLKSHSVLVKPRAALLT
jgi:hypothetical protein